MKRGFKRPIYAYLIHVLWFGLVAYWLATRPPTGIGRWVVWAAAAINVISFIYIILKRYYFEVVDDKLIINENVFKTTIIDLDKIEKIDMEPGPLTASKIVLKDQTKIKFQDGQVNEKKLREFMRQYNIPVE